MKLLSFTGLMACLLTLSAASPALALGLEAGPIFTLDDGAQSSREGPLALLDARGYISLPVPGLSVGVAGQFDLFDSDKDAYRVLGVVRYTLPFPLLSLFATASGGHTWKEVRGDDWVFSDEGMLWQVEAGLKWPVAPLVALVAAGGYGVQHSDAHSRNSTNPEWLQLATVRVALAFGF